MDSWQAVRSYAGEMYFFSLADSAALPVAALKDRPDYLPAAQRRDFAKRALEALIELSSGDKPLIHRALDPNTLRVRFDGKPRFSGWRWARMAAAQTISTPSTGEDPGPYAAPEVRSGGIAAAIPASDLYSLCAVLLDLFPDGDDDEAREVLKLGLERDLMRRPSPRDLIDLLEAKAPAPVASAEPDAEEQIPTARWDEGYQFEWPVGSGKYYRVVSALGQGGVGRTFKLEQLDRPGGEHLGTYVGKAVLNPDFGNKSLDAYQRLRNFIRNDRLSNILESARRADFIHVSVPPKGPLEFRFIEVKYRQHLRTARHAEMLDHMVKQTSELRGRWMDWFFSEQQSPLDRAVRRAQLGTLLRFYIDRAARHRLSGRSYARLMAEADQLVLEKTYKPGEVDEPDIGYVFCPEHRTGVEERIYAEHGDARLWLFGPTILPDEGKPRRGT